MPTEAHGLVVAGLGGPMGFGEFEVPRGDDASLQVDLSAVFSEGLNWFGTTLSADAVFVNVNGTVSFGAAFAHYPTEDAIDLPMNLIAPFWGDADTRLDGEGPESGSVYVDVDPVADVVTFTWHQVGVYRRNAEDLNTFQLQLHDRGNGDFDIILRYQRVDWDQGTAPDDIGARIGLSGVASGWHPLEDLPAPQSLPTQQGNTDLAGVWIYEMRDGVLAGTSNPDGDEGEVLTGTDASESMHGGLGNDTINAGGGDDTIDGGAGNDLLRGGAGNDRFYGGSGANTVEGGDGQDTLVLGVNLSAASAESSGNSLEIVINGGTALASSIEFFEFLDVTLSKADLLANQGLGLHIIGSDVDENLTGSDLGDTLEGGGGTDTLVGLDGNDVLIGGTSVSDLRDVIYGGNGNDSIDGGYGNDELRGDAGQDTILGGFGADTVIGGDGDDIMNGSALSDLMYGGDGDDFINGGFGFDRLNGGAGADRFYHLGILDHGSDWIQDFSGVSRDILHFGNSTASVSDFQINFANTPNAGAAGVDEAFVIYRPTNQIMWALVDGEALRNIQIQIGADIFDLLA